MSYTSSANMTYLNAINHLVEEQAVAIEINGVSYAVMLCSPYQLEEFVIGFLYSEKVIQHNRDIHDIELIEHDESCLVSVKIANRCAANLAAKQRQLAGTTGCGLCGTKSLAHAFPSIPPLTNRTEINQDLHLALCDIRQQLPKWQKIAEHSGALHAAFWLSEHGEIITCREDIGRHNALDKTIGYLIKHNIDKTSGALLVTSRCSVELVQKTITAGVSILVSLASPSQLAVTTASQHNLQLVHLPKHDDPVYFE